MAVVSLCSCFKYYLFFESKVGQAPLRDELGLQNDAEKVKNLNFCVAGSAPHDFSWFPEDSEFSSVVTLSKLCCGYARVC